MVAEVYTNKENTDQAIKLKSVAQAPYLISLGVVMNEDSDFIILLDFDQNEIQCVDQILHVSVDKNLKIHAIEQSKGDGVSDGELGI